MQRKFWRFLVLLHRYLGIAIGFLVLLWCLSGFVMMYVQYPALMPNERVNGLQALNFDKCCLYPSAQSFADTVVSAYSLESLGGVPILQLTFRDGRIRFVDLASGVWVSHWHRQQLEIAGRQFAESQRWSPPDTETSMSRDQWTVSARFDSHRPLIKFSNSDGLQWYVSSLSAKVVQSTSNSERFWNWIGAVPHWLYPTALRQRVGAWTQTVVWLSIVALFLTIAGLVIGIKQYKARRGRRHSPFRGWMLWHHYSGLLFGVLTLTWLVSGLLSMNPWGTMESRSFQSERERLNGVNLSIDEVFGLLEQVRRIVSKDTVLISDAHWMGTPYVMALGNSGQSHRFSTKGEQKSISTPEMQSAAKQLRTLAVEVSALDGEDTYYYGLHGVREFPMYRFIYEDRERYYVSPRSGRLIQAVDRNARWSRWFFRALHTGDFNAAFRFRPFWDIMMLLSLAGVTVGVASGTYLGLKRASRSA